MITVVSNLSFLSSAQLSRYPCNHCKSTSLVFLSLCNLRNLVHLESQIQYGIGSQLTCVERKVCLVSLTCRSHLLLTVETTWPHSE